MNSDNSDLNILLGFLQPYRTGSWVCSPYSLQELSSGDLTVVFLCRGRYRLARQHSHGQGLRIHTRSAKARLLALADVVLTYVDLKLEDAVTFEREQASFSHAGEQSVSVAVPPREPVRVVEARGCGVGLVKLVTDQDSLEASAERTSRRLELRLAGMRGVYILSPELAVSFEQCVYLAGFRAVRFCRPVVEVTLIHAPGHPLQAVASLGELGGVGEVGFFDFCLLNVETVVCFLDLVLLLGEELIGHACANLVGRDSDFLHVAGAFYEEFGLQELIILYGDECSRYVPAAAPDGFTFTCAGLREELAQALVVQLLGSLDGLARLVIGHLDGHSTLVSVCFGLVDEQHAVEMGFAKNCSVEDLVAHVGNPVAYGARSESGLPLCPREGVVDIVLVTQPTASAQLPETRPAQLVSTNAHSAPSPFGFSHSFSISGALGAADAFPYACPLYFMASSLIAGRKRKVAGEALPLFTASSVRRMGALRPRRLRLDRDAQYAQHKRLWPRAAHIGTQVLGSWEARENSMEFVGERVGKG